MSKTLFLGNDALDTEAHFIEVRDSFSRESTEVLRTRLAEDGYLCMRQLVPREAVLTARKRMLDFMESKGALQPDSTFDQPRGKPIGMMGNPEITHHPEFLLAVENPALFAFFERLFGETAKTFDYKWARAVPPSAAGTQAHMDYVYMGRGSKRLHTTWVPMGDIPRVNGPMVLLERSHAVESLQRVRDTYGKMDVDRDLVAGWFSGDYLELSRMSGTKWIVGDYRAGDVIVMGMHLMHGSLRNSTDYLRLTCDIRFQPAADPIDERWVGPKPIGHTGKKEQIKPIEIARKEWGV